MTGPGKYDDICTRAREDAIAGCALLIILDGEHGHGFSAQFTDPSYVQRLPAILRDIAKQIERDAQQGPSHDLQRN
jgi:hypothetical protein